MLESWVVVGYLGNVRVSLQSRGHLRRVQPKDLGGPL